MKNLKKIIAMGLTAALCAVSLAGCGGTQNGGTDGATDTNAKDTYKIGVLQYADHPSLDNCREGFKQGLDSEGIKYDITESSAKGDDSTNTQIAQQFVSQGMDLVCGIATPVIPSIACVSLSASFAATGSETALKITGIFAS